MGVKINPKPFIESPSLKTQESGILMVGWAVTVLGIYNQGTTIFMLSRNENIIP